MKTLLISALLLIAYALPAQQYGPTNDTLYLGFHRDSIAMLRRPVIVIVPFAPNRYLSEIDREIAKGTAYTYQHTRGFFRKGMDNALIIAAKPHNVVVSMHADDADINKDLNMIYRMTGVRVEPYEPPSISDQAGFRLRLARYWEKLQTNIAPQPEPGTRIEEGMLVSVEDNRELITKTRIVNPMVFDSLSKKYEADYVLFVNEFNMIRGTSDQYKLMSDDYDRLAIIHYSVYDGEGNELFSLKKKRAFSSSQNNLEDIIRFELLPLGYDVIYTLDSYRFLKAGLTPVVIQENADKSASGGVFAPLRKLVK
ncbi:MAG: hypothetical protein Kow0075_14320 [Salibacteraceae bacterium]